MAGQEWRTQLARPDGSISEVWLDFAITPWRYPDGRMRGVIGAAADVTPVVRSRIAAEQQTAKLRQHYEQSREVITALQRELLPIGLPVLPRTRIAASYLFADVDTSAGGDWFDAIVRANGTVALVVGDVVGHGVTASAVMGQLRVVLEDRLESGAGITEALGAVDRLVGRLPAAHATTICLAILDPMDGSVAYCTAGHPPPLLISASQGTRYLPATGGGPLGIGAPFLVREDHLDRDDVLLLFSDGILERPGREIGASTVELAQVAADAAAGRAMPDPGTPVPDRVSGQTVELLVRTTGHADDITMLAAQRVDAWPDLHLRMPAEMASLSACRDALGDWLDGAGTDHGQAVALLHAVGELVANAIEHAFVDGTGVFTLRATLTPDGYAHVTVADQGRWREPVRPSDRGRGLALATQLVNSLHIGHTDRGTVATIRHRLMRPARMLGGRPNGPDRGTVHRPADTPLLMVLDHAGTDSGRVRVDGPVDAGTATQLQHELMRRTRGGALPLFVDLTGVTHLASAGVATLHRLVARHRRQHAALTLYAEPGSPAQHIMTLVALPHTSSLAKTENQ